MVSVIVEFLIHYSTPYGKSLFLSGSSKSLGNWKLDQAVKLQWLPGDFWRVVLIFELCEQPLHMKSMWNSLHESVACLRLEYKYFVCDTHKLAGIEWEALSSNRIVSLNLQQTSSNSPIYFVKLQDTWSHSSSSVVPSIPLYSSASDTMNILLIVDQALSSDMHDMKRFNHTMHVSGSFNNWNTEDSFPMFGIASQNENTVTWMVALEIERHKFPLKYKYMLKSTNNMGVLWEGDENRVIRIEEDEITATILRDDGPFRLPKEYIGENIGGYHRCWLNTGFLGIQNLFASCSIISVIQVLYHIPKFRMAILNFEKAIGFSLNLRDMFEKLTKDTICPLTKEIVKAFGLPEDVHEFLRLICYYLEQEILSQTSSENIIVELFQGKLKYVVSTSANILSEREENYYDLSLDISTTDNLISAFHHSLNPTQMNGYQSDSQNVEQMTKLVTLPPILFVHLQRFYFDNNSNKTMKNCKHFEFPHSINLKEYVEFVDEKSNYNYRLIGVMIHEGDNSGDTGHFFSYIDINGEWYQFNDENVKKVTYQQVEVHGYGNNTQHAYMLVYSRLN